VTQSTPGHSLDVLLLADHTPPAVGGRESVLREIVLRQPAERSWLVAPSCGGAFSFDRECGAEIQRVPAWPWLGRAANRWIRASHFRWVTKKRAPHLVVAFGIADEGACALEIHRSSGAPYVLHLEAPELHAARRVLRAGGDRARVLQEILEASEAIVVASRACRESNKLKIAPREGLFEAAPVVGGALGLVGRVAGKLADLECGWAFFAGSEWR
jgi:hypothetical protein